MVRLICSSKSKAWNDDSTLQSERCAAYAGLADLTQTVGVPSLGECHTWPRLSPRCEAKGLNLPPDVVFFHSARGGWYLALRRAPLMSFRLQ